VANESIKGDIIGRLKKVGKFSHPVRDIILKWEMPKKGKIFLLKSYYKLLLTYGAETGAWTKADISRLTAVETKF
jgi:hypothetical protein